MVTPRPDYAYGIKRGVFAPLVKLIMTEESLTLLEVSPQKNNTFFVVEGKSNGGSVLKAHNQ